MAYNQDSPQAINQPDSGTGTDSKQPEPRTEMSPGGLLDEIDFERYIIQDMETNNFLWSDTEFAQPNTTEPELELAFLTLKDKHELSNTRLPLDSTLGNVPVHTFRDLLAHSITAATFGPAVEKLMQAFISLENLGRAYIAGFKEYSETDEYQKRFPEYQEAPLAPCAQNPYQQVLQGKSKKSKHGRKGQKTTISLSTVDLEQALKIAGQQWSIPSPEEITAESLFIDRVQGTLTSVPENSQSYAETMASESPALTPQQSSRYISLASRPTPLERQHTPDNARSETPPGHHAWHETPAPRTPIAAVGTPRSGSRQGTQFTLVNQRLPGSLPPSPTLPCATTNACEQREPLASPMAEEPPTLLQSGHGARDETPVPARPTTAESNSTPESPITVPSTSGNGPQDKTPLLVSSNTTSQNNKRADKAPTAGSEIGVTD
ncbi:hypothetical protein BO94DRAFT_581222 [Aspergillus sclerotioniger CBS 115572]|uniref:Uncharacterized protein n=1 Tax=Aspergillus sclerotioniger CBS 115572 TaxID=1450535 RepID=A0A317XC51_9EURO|nr:hypothetical protein BO94DRAFT_581222 [Aspergillus sclerotioniger CBS 115572]PWY96089.1 hypothetical protein BO94DRAFT_581222 [Aspergillus sclerotioniger CBS 115572]